MKAIAKIDQFPFSKEEIVQYKSQLKDEILSGAVDALQTKVKLTVLQKIINDILTDNDIDYEFVSEFMKHHEREQVIILGAKLRKAETGVRYDYKECGDPIWNDLDKQIKDLSEKKKDREKFLQNIPWTEGVVDPDTGVFITRAPKTSKTKIIVKL